MEYDTIAALSTPPGKGGIGVIRISGTQAIAIAAKLFPKMNLTAVKSHTLHLGVLKDGEKVLDEVVLGLFRNPKSFTGEDVIEISCHGSPFIIGEILTLLARHGARPAKPGEFTMRAFLNGKYDLTQAEAIGDLIASETAAAHDIAIKHLRSGFAGELKNIRQSLIGFSALLELELDFGEEDVQFANRKELTLQLDEIYASIGKMVDSFRLGNVLKNGVSAVIVGRPNAGKSTLLNALLNEQRAIVSEIEGTTRDAIESMLVIDGIGFRITDTAGIRETPDQLEQLGVEKTMQNIGQADMIIYLFDAGVILEAEVKHDIDKIAVHTNRPIIIVANKIDLSLADFSEGSNIFSISAKNGIGLETLKRCLCEKALAGCQTEESTVLTNARHLETLQDVLLSLSKAVEGLKANSPGEILASDLRSAMNRIGEITGEVTTDDLLENIFGRFCIGK